MAGAAKQHTQANQASVRRTFARRILLLSVAALVISAAILIMWWQQETQRHRLIVGTGPFGSDSHTLMREVAEVVSRHSDMIDLEVLETADPSENIALLNNRKVNLAAIRTDTPVASDVRLIANLYPDYFQIIVHGNRSIYRLADLEGARIAIPPFGTDAFRTFWIIAGHYDLPVDKMKWTATPFEEAQGDLLRGKYDAVFTVSSVRDRRLLLLFEDARLKRIPLRFLPIEQAGAMSLKRPFISAGKIPQGSFNGEPPLPSRDVDTAVLDRILVSRSDVPDIAIRELTRIMFENRLDLTIRFSLASAISTPDQKDGLGIPLHEGASQFFHRDEPSFIQENAEPLALMVTVFAMLLSGTLALRSRFVAKQKNRADRYNYQLLELKSQVAGISDLAGLSELRAELDAVLETVVIALDTDEVSDEGFHSFALLWETVRDTIHERKEELSA